MVAGRWTQHPSIVPDCPVCGLPLPHVIVDVDARSDGGEVRSLELTLQPLDAAWWDAAEQAHPTCGVRMARQRYLASLS
jgi:hypothetical protein